MADSFPSMRYLLLLLLALGVFGISCQKVEQRDILSADKKIQLTVPGGWREEKDLNEKADIQAGHRGSNQFVIVLSEGKEDFEGMTLQKHSDITRASVVESLKDPQVTGPKSLTINGSPALQYEIRGVFEGYLKIVYLHTTVETPKHFHQILTWTNASAFEKYRPTFEKIIGYFREL